VIWTWYLLRSVSCLGWSLLVCLLSLLPLRIQHRLHGPFLGKSRSISGTDPDVTLVARLVGNEGSLSARSSRSNPGRDITRLVTLGSSWRGISYPARSPDGMPSRYSWLAVGDIKVSAGLEWKIQAILLYGFVALAVCVNLVWIWPDCSGTVRSWKCDCLSWGLFVHHQFASSGHLEVKWEIVSKYDHVLEIAIHICARSDVLGNWFANLCRQFTTSQRCVISQIHSPVPRRKTETYKLCGHEHLRLIVICSPASRTSQAHTPNNLRIKKSLSDTGHWIIHCNSSWARA
jgi:hypothetical protein